MIDGIFQLADLDGTNGFRVQGGAFSGWLGRSVAGGGDFNGDGFDDVLIGDPLGWPPGRLSAGEVTVIYGSDAPFPAAIDPDALRGLGATIMGASAQGRAGEAVANAGDVNGDGFDDILIGAHLVNQVGRYRAGESYIVYGSGEGLPEEIDLADLDGNDGFALPGRDARDNLGEAVAGAGDVNGDGIDDFLIGVENADKGDLDWAGETYVVFGDADGFPARRLLSGLDGEDGFRIDGADARDFSGSSVAGVGDVNGDGVDDIAVGAWGVDPDGIPGAGATYIVFGSDTGFDPVLDLAALDGTRGFRISGVNRNDISGRAVSGAGDLNGDGFDDVLIGAAGGNPGGVYNAGEAYVLFGSDAGFAANVELASLNGPNGFRIDGKAERDYAGWSVAAAGDVNGDGLDDIVVGARFANGGFSGTGEAYVIFGSAESFGARFRLADIDGSNGFGVQGVREDDFAGAAVGSAGDVNGDGYRCRPWRRARPQRPSVATSKPAAPTGASIRTSSVDASPPSAARAANPEERACAEVIPPTNRRAGRSTSLGEREPARVGTTRCSPERGGPRRDLERGVEPRSPRAPRARRRARSASVLEVPADARRGPRARRDRRPDRRARPALRDPPPRGRGSAGTARPARRTAARASLDVAGTRRRAHIARGRRDVARTPNSLPPERPFGRVIRTPACP